MNYQERKVLRNRLNQIRQEIGNINPNKELIYSCFEVIDDIIDRDAEGNQKRRGYWVKQLEESYEKGKREAKD